MIPFDAVSKYPPTSPMVGQSEVFDRVEAFMTLLLKRKDAVFMTVIGDWGTGKTRVANELISEATSKSKGWLYEKEGVYEKRILIPDASQLKILPLMVKMADVVKHNPDKETVYWWTLYIALLNLHKGKESKDKDVREILDGIDSGVIRDLSSIVGNANNAHEAMAQCKKGLSRVLETGKVERVLVIIDEVETVGERREEHPGGVSIGLERDDIFTLFQAIKDQVNIDLGSTGKIEEVGYLILCSEVASDIEKEARIGANERRYRRCELSLPSRSDMLKLVECVKGIYPEVTSVDQKAFEWAFFISDRNLGWFNYVSEAICNEYQFDPDLDVRKLLQAVARKTGEVFLRDGIASIEQDPTISDKAKNTILPIITLLLPQSTSSLGFNLKQAKKLCRITDSDQTKILALMRPLEGFPLSLKRELTKSGYQKGSPEEDYQTIIKNDYKIAPTKLANSLSSFVDEMNRQLFYIDKEHLQEFLQQYYDSDMPEVVVEDVHKALLTLIPEDADYYIAPSVAFLTNLLKHVKDRIVRQKWISDGSVWMKNTALWKETLESAKETRRRTCEGLAKLLSRESELQTLDSLTSQHVIVSLNENDSLCITQRKQLLILFHQETDRTANDLRIYTRNSGGVMSPVVSIIIIDDESKREKATEAIAQADLSTSKGILVGTVPSRSLSQEFLVRHSFLNEQEGFKRLLFTVAGSRVRQSFENQWIELVDNQQLSLEQNGALLKPLLVSSRGGYKPEHLAEAYKKLLTGSRYPQDFEITRGTSRTAANVQLANLKKAIADNKERSEVIQKPVLGLFDGNYEPVFPAQLLGILRMLSLKSRSIKSLIPKFFMAQVYGVPIRNALQQSLDLLISLGVVHESQNEYSLSNKDFVSDQIKEAIIELRLLLEPSSGGEPPIEDIGGFFHPKILGDMKVNSGHLGELKGTLEDIDESDPGVDIDKLDSPDAISHLRYCISSLEQTQGEARKVLSTHEAIDNLEPNEVIDILEQLKSDTNYSEYGVKDRKKFLQSLKAIIEENINALEEQIDGVQNELKAIAEDFCVKPMERVLNSIRSQIQWGSEKPIQEIRMEEKNKTYSLRKFMEIGRISQIFSRLEHYSELLEEEDYEIGIELEMEDEE